MKINRSQLDVTNMLGIVKNAKKHIRFRIKLAQNKSFNVIHRMR